MIFAAAYLTALGARPASEHLAAAIHDETSGNPFFVRELYRHLVEEGRVESIDAGRAELSSSVPESIKHVISRRLARLHEPTARMLSEMSVFTRGFEYPLVRALTGMEESELLRCLDEALASGLVVERSGDGVIDAPKPPPPRLSDDTSAPLPSEYTKNVPVSLTA